VDNHFAVFADIQELVWARDRRISGPIVVTEANWNQSFFATGSLIIKGQSCEAFANGVRCSELSK
jgi:hypothetical protein